MPSDDVPAEVPGRIRDDLTELNASYFRIARELIATGYRDLVVVYMGLPAELMDLIGNASNRDLEMLSQIPGARLRVSIPSLSRLKVSQSSASVALLTLQSALSAARSLERSDG